MRGEGERRVEGRREGGEGEREGGREGEGEGERPYFVQGMCPGRVRYVSHMSST